MYLSSEFQRQLDDRFHSRFRLRWSDKAQVFHLEQKVATGQVMEPPIDPITNEWDAYDDGFIRARDGYFYVMTVTTGDRMRCPMDHTELKVPTLHTAETICPVCQDNQRDGRFAAGYFPLNHILLDYINDLDPLNGGPLRARERMRAKQLDRQAKEVPAAVLRGEEDVLDNQNQVELKPMVGYGPKTAQRGSAGIGEEAAIYDRMK